MTKARDLTPEEYAAARERIRRGLAPMPATKPAPAAERTARDLTPEEYAAARSRIRRGMHPFAKESE